MYDDVQDVQELHKDIDHRHVRSIEPSNFKQGEYEDVLVLGAELPLVLEGVVNVPGEDVDGLVAVDGIDVLFCHGVLQDQADVEP